MSTSVYYQQQNRCFISRRPLDDTTSHPWFNKFPIIRHEIVHEPYSIVRLKHHYSHGMVNVRSDDDLIEGTCDLSFIDAYNYTIELEKYTKWLDKLICSRCHDNGHLASECHNTHTIMGWEILDPPSPYQVREVDDDDEYD